MHKHRLPVRLHQYPIQERGAIMGPVRFIITGKIKGGPDPAARSS